MSDAPRFLFEEERAAYEARKPELLTKHAGKFVLIHGGEIAGVFDTDVNALQAGYERFGPVPLLIEQVLPQAPEQSAPALSLGILTAAS
jgi:hypothetical protein